MNCRLVCLCIAAASFVSSALHAEDELLLDQEKVHFLIREAAAKIEERYKSVRPEADGLVQRVEETLAAAPATPNKSDRARKLAGKMKLMFDGVSFNSGIRGISGAVFDYTTTGFMQRYQDLESASTRDAEEVWRWMEMADAARFLKWQEKKEICTQRAVGAARALISREPKNAEAYALLGLTLEWSGEKLAALQTALRLDPKQPLALNELLLRRVEQTLEAAALRQDIRLEEKSKDVTHALFDHPLTDAETVAYERQANELEHDLTRLFALAEQRGDLRTYLSNVLLQSILRQHHDEVTAAAERRPEEDFEMFESRMDALMMNHVCSIMADEKFLKPTLKLTGADPESMGAILLLAILGDGSRAKAEGRQINDALSEIFRPSTERLAEIAGADDSLRAARAVEAVFLADLSQSLLLEQQPKQMEHLMRAIHLDPFRLRTQQILMMACTGEISKDKNLPAAAALSLIGLALMPDLQTRRTCAASLARVHDWPAAHRYLDACLKEKPDDVGLLNQKAVTYLRESQSKAAQKKAEIYYHKIESLFQKQASDSEPDKNDLRLIARDHILFLLMGGKNNEVREELVEVREGDILNEKECKELEKLLP